MPAFPSDLSAGTQTYSKQADELWRQHKDITNSSCSQTFQGLCIKLDDDPLPIFFPRLQYLLPITLNQSSSLFSLFTKECFLLSCRTNSSLHTPVSIFTFLCFSAFSGSGRKRTPLSGMSISTNMHYAHCSWLAAAEGYFSSQVHQVVLQTLIWLLHLHRQMLDDCIQVKPRRR